MRPVYLCVSSLNTEKTLEFTKFNELADRKTTSLRQQDGGCAYSQALMSLVSACVWLHGGFRIAGDVHFGEYCAMS